VEGLLKMKKIFNKIGFLFKFSYKNILFHPLRSILLAFGFLGISITILLTVSMHQMMFTYFYGQIEEKYQETDMVIEVSDTGDSRFFSIRNFNEPNISNIIKTYDAFFEFDVLVDVNENQSYVHVYASTLESLNHISKAMITYDELEDDQVIVTQSFAEKNGLNVGDTLTLLASDSQKAFEVVEIVEDGHLFSGQSIFIDKQTSITFFLESLSPSLESLPPTLLTNFYNKVYVDLNDHQVFEDARTMFMSDEAFENLTYIQTYDLKQIDINVSKSTALFDAILIFIFGAIILVLETTLLVYFSDKKKTNSTIYLLGGKKSFSLSILFIELMFISVVSFVLSVLSVNRIYHIGLSYLGSDATFKLSIMDLVVSFVIFFIVFLISIGIHVFKFRGKTDVNQIHDEGEEKTIVLSKLGLTIFILLVLFVIFKLEIINQLIGSYQSLVVMILSMILLYLIVFFIVNLFKYIKVKTKKATIIHLLFKKKLNKKQFYHFISMNITVFLVVFLLVFTVNHLQERINRLSNEYQFDLIVTRMITDQNTIYNEISQMDDVEAIEQVAYFEYVETNVEDQLIEQVISIDPKDIDTFFNFNIDQASINAFSDLSIPHIILPQKYAAVNHLSVGDNIQITIDQTYKNISLKIAGFYEKEAIELAFINLYAFEDYDDIAYNSIIIDSSDKEILENQLIENYGKQMVIIFDFNEKIITPLTEQMHKVKNYFTVIVGILLISFILSLFNHQTMLNLNIAPDDAKILTLGLSKKRLAIYEIFQYFVLFIISVIISAMVFFSIYSVLADFITLFNTYERLHIAFSIFYIGFGINFVIWMIMMSYQMTSIKALEPINYIRTY
jgi:hypothetical protein